MFKPLCIAGKKALGHSAAGWLSPCCWLDPNSGDINDENIKSLYKDKLKIENVDTIEDILFSDEWLNFMNILKSNDELQIPVICKTHCSQTPNPKIKTYVK